MPDNPIKYAAFLRGINVGGAHKVPMADLKKVMARMGYKNIITLLNSGNILFDAEIKDIKNLEKTLSDQLEKSFGFPIPTIVRSADSIRELLERDPFQGIELTKNLRFYITFLRQTSEKIESKLSSDDGSFRIIDQDDKHIFSILDVDINNTPKGMGILEKAYRKDITTRNWNTILRIEKKLK